MRRFLATSACVVFLGVLVLGTGLALQPDTGDRKLDSLLDTINKGALTDPGGFLELLSLTFNIPEEKLRTEWEQHGLEAGDWYLATALGSRTRRPVGDIATEYRENQGKGWGVTAMSMGIKPGSPEFKELKRDAGGFVDQMKAKAKSKKQHEKALEKQHRQQIKGKPEGKGQGKRNKGQVST